MCESIFYNNYNLGRKATKKTNKKPIMGKYATFRKISEYSPERIDFRKVSTVHLTDLKYDDMLKVARIHLLSHLDHCCWVSPKSKD